MNPSTFNPLDPENIQSPLSKAEKRLHRLHNVYPWYFATFWAVVVTGLLWQAMFEMRSSQMEAPVYYQGIALSAPGRCAGPPIPPPSPEPVKELPPEPEIVEVPEVWGCDLPVTGIVDEPPTAIIPEDYPWDELPDSIGDIIAPSSIPDLKDIYDSLDEKPHPINLHQIQKEIGYPQILRDAGVMGGMRFRMLIDEEGKYIRHEWIKELHPIMSAEVAKHIHRLRYTPAVYHGEPVSYWLTIPMHFCVIN